MKKILIIIICLFSISAYAMEKKTTFNKELFNKAQSDGKNIIVRFQLVINTMNLIRQKLTILH